MFGWYGPTGTITLIFSDYRMNDQIGSGLMFGGTKDSVGQLVFEFL